MRNIITWLKLDDPFPSAEHALNEPDGLLACGADLSTNRLIQAYSQGVFPWYIQGQPILWWSPSKRMVLNCNDFKISHSLRKKLRKMKNQEIREGLISGHLTSKAIAQPNLEVRIDTSFSQLIHLCNLAHTVEKDQIWISSEMEQAYIKLHEQGIAHSIEIWSDQRLVGGLYGISIGTMFFGESMFSIITDTSKIALSYAINYLKKHGVKNIDCQIETDHLRSLGARLINREKFIELLKQAQAQDNIPWVSGRLLSNGNVINTKTIN